MSTNSIKLVNFTVKSFAKIDKSNPVIIVWPSDDNKNISLFTGDQAVGKTSVISAFAAACGLPLIQNAINKVDNDRKVSFEFIRNGNTYKVTITKTRFEIETLVGDKWAKLGSPKTVLQDALGPVGQSPMFLKEYSGEDQIKWLRSFYQLSESQAADESKINTDIKTAYSAKRDAKRMLKAIDLKLNANQYFINRAEWDKKIEEHKNADQEKISNIQTKHTHYIKSKEALENLKLEVGRDENEMSLLDSEILELEEKLNAKKKLRLEKSESTVTKKERIKAGESYIEENKFIIEEYNQIESIVKERADMASHEANYNQMLTIVQEQLDYTEKFDENSRKLEEYRKSKIDFIKTITPAIEGFEVCVPDQEEEENETEGAEKREGLYYQGKSVSELSESELWSFYLLLLKAMNIKIVIIENISNLGSGAIDMLNYYASEGGYIIASEMKREEKSLKITVTNKIAE